MEAVAVKRAEKAARKANVALLLAESQGDPVAVEEVRQEVDARASELAAVRSAADGGALQLSVGGAWGGIKTRVGDFEGGETVRTESSDGSIASHASAYISPSRLRDWAARGPEARHPTRSKVYPPSKAAEQAANQGIIIKDGGRVVPLFDLEPQRLDLPKEGDCLPGHQHAAGGEA